jgi:hypothetical protein
MSLLFHPKQQQKHRKKKERGKGREAKFKEELKMEEMIGPRN